MLRYDLFVQSLLLRILDDILHPHESLFEIINIFDIPSDQSLYDELSCLIAIMLQQIINDKFIKIKQVPNLAKMYS